MFSIIFAPILGIIAGLLFLVNILICASLVIICGILKIISPFSLGKKFFNYLQNEVITSVWIDINNCIIQLAAPVKWEVYGQGELHFDHWYFVFANHQTWADILVLQKVFNRKIHLLKFFLKKELLWSLPLGGLACWMLDFPVMRRYSKTQLKRNPALRNKDIETTRESCRKFKQEPTTIMNFLEGTRFTPQKQQDRSSPYQHLLRPKGGGLAFVVNELKGYIHEVIDVTIVYSHADPTFWNFLCGRVHKVIVYYDVIPLQSHQYGDYYGNSSFRKNFQGWVNECWQRKDKLIATILTDGNIEENLEVRL